MTRVELMYLTSAALTNLRSCLLRSASSYKIAIAGKVSAITRLTLRTRKPERSTSLAAIDKITAVQTWSTSTERAAMKGCARK